MSRHSLSRCLVQVPDSISAAFAAGAKAKKTPKTKPQRQLQTARGTPSASPRSCASIRTPHEKERYDKTLRFSNQSSQESSQAHSSENRLYQFYQSFDAAPGVLPSRLSCSPIGSWQKRQNKMHLDEFSKRC